MRPCHKEGGMPRRPLLGITSYTQSHLRCGLLAVETDTSLTHQEAEFGQIVDSACQDSAGTFHHKLLVEE